MITAKYIIGKLGLKPLPHEGGFYRETYRSAEKIPHTALPPRFSSDRAFSTAIYYLLTPDTHSALHRLLSDEIFHFYCGDAVIMLHLYPDGSSKVITLGGKIDAGEHPQVMVPAGTWQGAFLKSGGRFALMGTTVAPGFEFSDYEAGNRRLLMEYYPEHRDLITKLTPDE